MKQTTLKPTQKGHLNKSKRTGVTLRLETDLHADLKEAADKEQRSMGFVVLRRYLKGRDVELAEQNQ